MVHYKIGLDIIQYKGEPQKCCIQTNNVWGKRRSAFTVHLSLQCNVFSRTVMVHAITMGRDTVDTKAVVVYVKTLVENKKPLS